MYDGVISLMKKYFPFFFKKEEADSEFFKFDIASLDFLHTNASTVSFIYNHQTLTYDYFSPNIQSIMGYNNKDFKEGGLKFSMSLVHPEHNRIYNKNILPVMFKYYSLYALNGRVKDLKFTYSFKIKKRDGTYLWMLHHMSALQLTKLGFPIRTLVQLTDVSGIKKDEAIDLTILVKGKNHIYKPIYTKIYSDETKFALSERELDILYLLYEGKTTKEIADELNISFHTVNTHRKNMLKKSNMKNTAELMKIINKK
jgi:DNA-binding CsgD family transcriptional regulator